MPDVEGTTRLVNELAGGDREAAERLMPRVYDELHGLAENHFRRQPSGHTLQPTALVNEAFVRLIDRDAVDYRGRAHFMAVAALAMRQILVDHARRRNAARRGGGRPRLTLTDADLAGAAMDVDVLALDEALTKLAEADARAARVVGLRFFSGLSMEETAEVLGVARSTVAEDWRFAKAWLATELGGDEKEGPA
ncbi:MAG: ECF-type sigma factor [Planctomycetota bacterium]|jgi:RNA polymerase sigma factor (TIGR02999 family)